jgi:hypothetical protein
MRSSSFIGGHIPSYGEERDRQTQTWLSDIEDTLAKIKGSSLKHRDRIEAIKQVDLLLAKYKLQIEEQ